MVNRPEVVCQVTLCDPVGLWLPPTSLISSTFIFPLPVSSLCLSEHLVHWDYILISICAFSLGLHNCRVSGQASLITSCSPGHLSHWGKVLWSHLCSPAWLSRLMAEKDSAGRAANCYDSFLFLTPTPTHPHASTLICRDQPLPYPWLMKERRNGISGEIYEPIC